MIEWWYRGLEGEEKVGGVVERWYRGLERSKRRLEGWSRLERWYRGLERVREGWRGGREVV